MICRTVAEALAAGTRDGQNDPPLSQDQADLVAAILTPRQQAKAA